MQILEDLVMRQPALAFSRFLSFTDVGCQSLDVIEITIDRLLTEFIARHASIRCKLREPRFQVWRKVNELKKS